MTQLKPYNGTDYYLWKYLPSRPAALVAIALFLVVTCLHCWRMFRTRCWFTIPFAIGGIFQVIGYIARLACYDHTDQLGPYVIQSTLILLAPVLYAASIYMVLGRLIRSVHGERFSVIRPSLLTKIFVIGDVLSLLVQGNAAGLTAKSSTQKLGEHIITAGLFVQIIMFGLFCVVAMVFHMRMQKNMNKERPVVVGVPWKQGLMMLYACSTLIMIRSIFRVIEYIMGADGWLLMHEWPSYVFDAALMFLVQLIFFIRFPSQFKLERNYEHPLGDV